MYFLINFLRALFGTLTGIHHICTEARQVAAKPQLDNMSCRISLRQCDPSAVCHQVGRVTQQKLLNWFRGMRSYRITESSADKSVKWYKAPVCNGPPDQSADEEKKGIQDAQQRKHMPINALAPHLQAIQR